MATKKKAKADGGVLVLEMRREGDAVARLEAKLVKQVEQLVKRIELFCSVRDIPVTDVFLAMKGEVLCVEFTREMHEAAFALQHARKRLANARRAATRAVKRATVPARKR